MDHTTHRVWTSIVRVVRARRGALPLACIVLLSFAFRLHLARECSLWLDEVVTHLGVRRPWPEIIYGPSRVHPPLMYLMVRLATDVVGSSEAGLRSVSLVFGCLLLMALYELCLELKLSLRRSLFVVLTLALSPFLIRHATEARHYAILATFATFGTTRTLRMLRGSQRTFDLAGLAISAVAMAATHYFGLAYAAALLGSVGIDMARTWRATSAARRLVAAGWLLPCLPLLAYLGFRAAAVARGFALEEVESAASPTVSAELFRDLAREFSFLRNDVWAFFVQPVLAVLGLVLFTRRLRGVARLLPLGLGVVPCVVAFFISSQHFVAPRYLAPSAVLYHLGACRALFAVGAAVRRGLAHRRRLLLLAPQVGWLALAGLVAVRLREYPKGFGAGLDDYRGLQRYFKTKLAGNTALVVYPGYFGKLLLGKEYSVGVSPISLEGFRPVRGIRRYLIVEIHSDTPERRAEIESLVGQGFAVPAQAWRSLPRVALPRSVYQTSVPARLLQFPSDWVPPRPYAPSRRHRRVGKD